MARTLTSVMEFAKPGNSPFGEHSLRWFIFNRTTNGLDEFAAIVKIGRRVYIDTAAFERWIDSQQAKPRKESA